MVQFVIGVGDPGSFPHDAILQTLVGEKAQWLVLLVTVVPYG